MQGFDKLQLDEALEGRETSNRMGAKGSARKGQKQRELTISVCRGSQGGNVFTPLFTPEPENEKAQPFQIGLSY